MAPTRRSGNTAATNGGSTRRASLPRQAKDKVQSYAGLDVPKSRVTKKRSSPRAAPQRRQTRNNPPAQNNLPAPNNTAAVVAPQLVLANELITVAGLPFQVAQHRHTEAQAKAEETDKEEPLMCEICSWTEDETPFPTEADIPEPCRNHALRSACRNCIVRYAREDLNHASLPHCYTCGRPWSFEHAVQLLGLKDMERFEARISNRLIEGDANFRWCAQDKCESGQYYFQSLVEKDPKVCCASCEKVNCFACRSPWHEGMTCAEYQDPVKREERIKDDPYTKSLGTMRKNVTKKCPICGSGTEKVDGCNHMVCKFFLFLRG